MSPKHNTDYDYLLGKKKCLVMLAANYGNLGDVAITYAQELWLQEHFPDYEIVDVPITDTLSHLKVLKNLCTPEDVVTIVGGGNMSDLYFDIELLRQMVVKAFPNNRIISFPQTMFFSDTITGRYLKRLSRKAYTKHHRITISAREQQTYDIMRKLQIDCLLIPDIAMTLDKHAPIVERHGITLCLRDDAELCLGSDFKRILHQELSQTYEVNIYDTHIGSRTVSLEAREVELQKIWSQFRSSQCIITDRLHGMVFAFITGTRCIVLPNNNHKIEGSFRWIEDSGFIHFIKDADIDSIHKIIDGFPSSKFNPSLITNLRNISEQLL